MRWNAKKHSTVRLYNNILTFQCLSVKSITWHWKHYGITAVTSAKGGATKYQLPTYTILKCFSIFEHQVSFAFLLTLTDDLPLVLWLLCGKKAQGVRILLQSSVSTITSITNKIYRVVWGCKKNSLLTFFVASLLLISVERKDKCTAAFSEGVLLLFIFYISNFIFSVSVFRRKVLSYWFWMPRPLLSWAELRSMSIFHMGPMECLTRWARCATVWCSTANCWK